MLILGEGFGMEGASEAGEGRSGGVGGEPALGRQLAMAPGGLVSEQAGPAALEGRQIKLRISAPRG